MPQACNIAAIGECMSERSQDPDNGNAPAFRHGFAGTP
jgi:hypothetical protein